MASSEKVEHREISHATWEWAKTVVTLNRITKPELPPTEAETTIDDLVQNMIHKRVAEPKRTS